MTEEMVPSAPQWVRLAARLIRLLPAGRYRAIERLCRNPPGRFRIRTPLCHGGHWFICDLQDSIAREVCFTGLYEPQETALARALLRPGMTFVDVGANWGYFTLLGSHLVGPSGRVLSLEPDPRLFRLLQINLAMNHLRQVIALPIAAGTEPGWLTLIGFDKRMGNFGLSHLSTSHSVPAADEKTWDQVGSNKEEDMNSFRVLARPLDELLREEDIDHVDLLKMDIEGAEGMALSGMRDYLERRLVRKLILELHPKQLAEQGQSAAEIIHQLLDFGYLGWRIDHTPRGNRRAAYRKHSTLPEILQPLDPKGELDAWPHLLWILPEVGRI